MPRYDDLFQTYIEACSGTQVISRGGGSGGPGGHTFLYLKGVCRDRSVHFPRLKVCDGAVAAIASPDDGVTVSVDSSFATANWVAVDGRTLGVTGGVDSSGHVDQALLTRLAKQAAESGAFDGVRLHDELYSDKPADVSAQEWTARKCIGTDVAVGLGRNLTCVRIPVERSQLASAVGYLNGINEPYTSGRKTYSWDMFRDSCAHMVRNTLAAAGIVDPVEVDTPYSHPLRLWENFAFPANDILEAADAVTPLRVPDVAEAFGNQRIRSAFEKYGWLPYQGGGIVFRQQAPWDNDVFEPSASIAVKENSVYPLRTREYAQLGSESMADATRGSLVRTRTLLRAALARRRSLAELTAASPALSRRSFAAFYAHYWAWIDSQLKDAGKKLALLEFGPRAD